MEEKGVPVSVFLKSDETATGEAVLKQCYAMSYVLDGGMAVITWDNAHIIVCFPKGYKPPELSAYIQAPKKGPAHDCT